MPVVVMYSLPLLGGIVCGTVLQIAQRAAGVGIVARISCDVALMLGGAAIFMMLMSNTSKRIFGGNEHGGKLLFLAFHAAFVGGLLVVTGAVAMTEGALLTTLLVLEDMAFPAS